MRQTNKDMAEPLQLYSTTFSISERTIRKMAVILIFTIEKEEFTLGQVLFGILSVHIELGQIAPTEHRHALPLVAEGDLADVRTVSASAM